MIGLDGMEPRIVEPMLERGLLPNLARLRDQGGYSRVATTYPAQTPVAWSTFATGTNPGAHGIFDFIRRDPRTYLPDLAFTRYEQRAPWLPPTVVNLRGGVPVWAVLSEAGLPSTILRCPCTFPPEPIRGRMLAGMGVPDLRGGQGTSTLYTSEDGVKAQESERVVTVRADADGTVVTQLLGPRNPKSGSDLSVELRLRLEPAARKVVVRLPGRSRPLELHEREWSRWMKVRFRAGFLHSVRGIVRFHLARISPALELYASPVNFDPEAPMFPISWPARYARDLAASIGTFYTTGMVEDHGGLDHGRLSEVAYLEQCSEVLAERQRMMLYGLARHDEGLFFCLFDTPDRLQHMFWRDRRETAEAPARGGEPRASDVIREHYRACDAVVGEALRAVDDQTLCMVLSDHGMNSFDRGVHLNTWLHEQGLLALREGSRPGPEAGDFFRCVDWERTRAYALGLGGIYLNLKGREERGVVDASEAETLKSSLASALTGLGDPVSGKTAIRSVVTREQIYSGPFAAASPDLLVNFDAGFRVSWGTALGAVPQGLFEDNERRWSGDHLMDPSLVPGVLFMNRPFRAEGANLVHLAPTILAALGVPKGGGMEGGSLLQEAAR